MKRLYIVGAVFYVLVIVAGIGFLLHDGIDDQGIPNIPLFNERANACYGGASLSGACVSDEDWICGWSVIRLENGLLTREELPAECVALLPSISSDSSAS